MKPIIETPTIEDETALDKELQDSLDGIKAGKTEEQNPTKPVEKETSQEVTDSSVQDNSAPANAPAEREDTFRIPVQGKTESDEAYEKRVELFDLVKRRKAASTPEAKKLISEEIKAHFRAVNGPGRFNNFNKSVEENNGVKDPTIAADQERLRQLGGATQEDIAKFVAEERLQQNVRETLGKFIDRTPELKDDDMREVFFDFVEENYVWQGKSGKELLQVLEMARENMFKPSETIQERVLKGADVAGKVNAMQFPGGTGAKADFSPEMKQSIKELTDTGMSEEKAIELLSD